MRFISLAHILLINENIRSAGAFEPRRHKQYSTIFKTPSKDISLFIIFPATVSGFVSPLSSNSVYPVVDKDSRLGFTTLYRIHYRNKGQKWVCQKKKDSKRHRYKIKNCPLYNMQNGWSSYVLILLFVSAPQNTRTDESAVFINKDFLHQLLHLAIRNSIRFHAHCKPFIFPNESSTLYAASIPEVALRVSLKNIFFRLYRILI